jgi:hypothetical protein
MSSSERLHTTLFHHSRQEPVIFREHLVFYPCTEQSGAGCGEPAFTKYNLEMKKKVEPTSIS